MKLNWAFIRVLLLFVVVFILWAWLMVLIRDL